MDAKGVREWLKLFVEGGPWLWRLFVDNRFWVFVALSFILLFASLRFHMGDKNPGAVARSPQFLVPLTLLFAAWIFTYYTLYWPSRPPDDGLIYVTVADFGSGEKAARLQDELSAELEKHLRLFENVSFRRQALRETVDSVERAEKLARARGLHLVIFGETEVLDDKRYLVRATLLQVNPYKKIQLGRFSFERQTDLSSLDGLRTLAKYMAVKVLRTCDQNYLLALAARHNQLSFNMSMGRERRTTFNVGSNITQRFLLGDKSDGHAFLEGTVSAEGEPFLSGRVFDSDGKSILTIKDNRPVDPDPEAFSIQQRGRSFTVRDRYDRILIEYKVEDNQNFIERYVNAGTKQAAELRKKLQSERGIRIPLQDYSARTRQALSGFGRIVTINGEIYREDGLLGVILSDEDLYQYALNAMQF